jgi:GNAT superfamily N-acetyltransferase
MTTKTRYIEWRSTTHGTLDNMKTTIQLTTDDLLVALAADDIDLRLELDRRAKDVATEIGVTQKHVLEAWNHPNVHNASRAFGHMCMAGSKAFFSTTSMAAKTMEKGFEALHKSSAGQKLHKGAEHVDAWLDEHPKMKAAAGIAVAGMMYKGWTMMSFMGDLDYDFDYTTFAEIASGEKGLADALTSPSGLMYTTLLATGAGLGLGFAWAGGTAANTALGLTYTAAKHLRNGTGAELLNKLEKNDFIKLFVSNGRKVAKAAGDRYGNVFRHIKARVNAAPDWWKKLDRDGQESYLDRHPGSRLEVTATEQAIKNYMGEFPILFDERYILAPNQIVLLNFKGVGSAESEVDTVGVIRSITYDDDVMNHAPSCTVMFWSRWKDGTLSGYMTMDIVVHRYLSSNPVTAEHAELVKSTDTFEPDELRRLFYVENRENKYIKVKPFEHGQLPQDLIVRTETRPDLMERRLSKLIGRNVKRVDEWSAMLRFNRGGQKSWSYIRDGDDIIGCAILEYKVYVLGTVGVLVDKDHRGQGYATRLLEGLKHEVLRNHRDGTVECPAHVEGLIRSVFAPEFQVCSY